MNQLGRLNRRLGVSDKDEIKEEERQRYAEEIQRQQEQQRQAYEEYLRQQQMREQQQLMDEYQQRQQAQPIEEEEPEEDEYETYKDVPIKRAIDIQKKPTPKGYFPTIISGIPVDLHALEEYIVKTSPFAIKTLLRFDNARNIEEIKNYSTKSSGKKKMDSKFFLLLFLGIALAIGGILVIFFMPELIGMFKGMAP